MSANHLLRAADSVDATLHALRAIDDLLSASADEAFHRISYLTSPVVAQLIETQSHIEAARASQSAAPAANPKEK